MKTILFVTFLSVVLGTTQAGTLEISNSNPVNFNNFDGQPLSITGAENSGLWGSLFTTSAGVFSVTYLGNESGYVNNFSLDSAGGTLLESDSLGRKISKFVDSGTVGFSFSDNASSGHTFRNGGGQHNSFGFAILKGQTNRYGSFDYILGFNDSYSGDADYDDFVVGVNFNSVPVPEPETYAMLFAGIGLIGLSARRRKNDSSE
jgi:PEP-CTERM motif